MRPAGHISVVIPFPPSYLQESVGDLMIRNIQLSHSGKYLCMVQTTLESLSAVADIIVRGKHKRWK